MDLRVCVSHNFLDDVNAACVEATFCIQWPRIRLGAIPGPQEYVPFA